MMVLAMKFLRSPLIIALLSTALLTIPAARGQHKSKPIPLGSTLYVDTNNGFDLFILAAFTVKEVPMKLVPSKDQADFVLDSSLFHDKEFLATGNTAGTYRVSEAAFKLTNKAGDIIWAYAATRGLLSKGGKQSVAESCAKHIKPLCVIPKRP
jgi:hypothetical protein